MLQTLLWRRMTCSFMFLKYPLAVLVQTLATYILMYCNASSTAFPALRCFKFRKKLLGLYATLYRSSDRTVQLLCLWPENEHERQLCEEFAPQPGGTNDNDTHFCEPICINMYCRAKHNNQEKYYSFIEGRSDKNFRVVNLFTGSIFAIILFCTVMLFGSQAWSSLSFVPPGWGVNSSENCRSCSFCSHKQRCWTVLPELWYEVASNLNPFFLS